MNQPDTIVRVNNIRRGQGQPPVSPEIIESIIPDALERYARVVAKSNDRALLEKDFTAITITNGIADLSAKTDLLIDYIKKITHSDSTVPPFSRLSYISDLDSPRNEMYTWYVIANNKIYTRLGDAVSVPADGTLTVQASFIPTISTLPLQLEDGFVLMVVAILSPAAAAVEV